MKLIQITDLHVASEGEFTHGVDLRQNFLDILKAAQSFSPDLLILSGDHIYKMDYSKLVSDHIQSEADATIGCIPVTLREATEFGVMGIDENRRVIQFDEKLVLPE